MSGSRSDPIIIEEDTPSLDIVYLGQRRVADRNRGHRNLRHDSSMSSQSRRSSTLRGEPAVMNHELALSLEHPSPSAYEHPDTYYWISLEFLLDYRTTMALLWILCHYGFISLF